MPLMKPDIQNALRAVGLDKTDNGDSVKDSLKNNNLGVDDLLRRISETVSFGENEHSRLRAIELGLKLHGLLKEGQTSQVPSITININDPSSQGSVNPVLVPREIQIQ